MAQCVLAKETIVGEFNSKLEKIQFRRFDMVTMV